MQYEKWTNDSESNEEDDEKVNKESDKHNSSTSPNENNFWKR